MLGDMSPEEFDERFAHYLIEPWGDEWQIGGLIAAEVHNAVTRYIYAKSQRSRVPDSAWTKGEDFIPRPKWAKEDKRGKSATVSADDPQAADKLARMLGF